MAEAIVDVVVLLASVVGLWVGARSLVDAAVRLARRVGLSDLVVGLTVVAAGTSSPELVVTADAALGGLGNIAVGNVVGSSLFNLTLVLGLVAFAGSIAVRRRLVHRDGVALLASTFVATATLLDRTVARWEGLLLVGLLVAYTAYLLRRGRARTGPDGSSGVVASRVTQRVSFRGRDALLLAGGLAVVLASGHFLVLSASSLARAAGVSEWVIGGTVVAAGTSTPELAVSVVALRRGSVGVSVGNVLGSNVFNLLGIMGVGAVLAPLTIAPSALPTVAWLVVVSVAVVAALWSGRELTRREGGVLALSEVLRWAASLTGLAG
jgi:cation:H+ antiporter